MAVRVVHGLEGDALYNEYDLKNVRKECVIPWDNDTDNDNNNDEKIQQIVKKQKTNYMLVLLVDPVSLTGRFRTPLLEYGFCTTC